MESSDRPPEIDSPTFLVLGMHRSGTSALARTLSLLGLRHSDELLAPDLHNPTGYWEPRKVVQFNDRLLNALDRHWADPKPLPSGWADGAQSDKLVSDAVALLRSEFGTAGKMVIKDPRLSRAMPIWRNAFRKCGAEPVCLISCRNPMDVYRSLKARDLMSFDHAAHLWLTYMLEAEASTRGMRRAVVVYDDLLNDWRATLRLAFDVAGLPDMNGFESQKNAVDGFINQKHRHHRSTPAELFTNPDAGDNLKETYDLFSRDGGLESLDEFDRLRQHWQTAWERRSPGLAGSKFVRQMPGWHLERSRILLSQEHTGEAIEAALEAGKLGSDDAPFHHYLGSLLAKDGRLEDAEAAQRRAIALDGDKSHYYRALSGILDRRGRIDEAIAEMSEAAELDPEQPPLHSYLGKLLAKAGQLEDAEAAQRRAIALDGSVANYHWTLSAVLDQLGRTGDAIEEMRTAVKLEPEHPPIYNYLGTLLAKSGQLEGAETAQRRAIALDGGVSHYYWALGAVLNQMGRTVEAIEVLRQAVELNPERPPLHNYLAKLLAKAGQHEEAEVILEKARKLDT